MLHVAKMHRGVGCMLRTAIKQCSCSFNCLFTKMLFFNCMDYDYQQVGSIWAEMSTWYENFLWSWSLILLFSSVVYQWSVSVALQTLCSYETSVSSLRCIIINYDELVVGHIFIFQVISLLYVLMYKFSLTI